MKKEKIITSNILKSILDHGTKRMLIHTLVCRKVIYFTPGFISYFSKSLNKLFLQTFFDLRVFLLYLLLIILSCVIADQMGGRVKY